MQIGGSFSRRTRHLAALAMALASSLPTASAAFGVVCCTVVIDLPNAPWVGYSRDCRKGLGYASQAQLAAACAEMRRRPGGVCPDAQSFCSPGQAAPLPAAPRTSKGPIGGTGEPAKDEPKGEERDNCPSLGSQESLFERDVAEWRSKSRALSAQMKQIEALTERAHGLEAAFNSALSRCYLWETAQVIASLLPKPPVFEAAEKFLDPPSMLELEVRDVDLGGLIGVVSAGYDITRPRSWEEQVDRLRQCPQDDAILQRAVDYIRLHQQIEARAKAAQKAANDLRSFEIHNMASSGQKYRDACNARAQCKGLPATICSKWPPPAELKQKR